MAPSVEPEQLERLLEARHRSKISLIIVVAVVIAVSALLISLDVTLPVPLCVLAGLYGGRLLNAPYRRKLTELGLTRPEAMSILVAEQERRSGRALLPPQVRARQDQRASLVYLVCGLAATAVLIVAAFYFFGEASKPVEENAPTDVWFAVSAIAGSVTLILAPTCLWMARRHHDNAATWRAR